LALGLSKKNWSTASVSLFCRLHPANVLATTKQASTTWNE
jgi:hypothetical protein